MGQPETAAAAVGGTQGALPRTVARHSVATSRGLGDLLVVESVQVGQGGERGSLLGDSLALRRDGRVAGEAVDEAQGPLRLLRVLHPHKHPGGLCGVRGMGGGGQPLRGVGGLLLAVFVVAHENTDTVHLTRVFAVCRPRRREEITIGKWLNC